MFKFVLQFVQNTVKDGIGQAIIAFSAWIYVFILFVAVIFYAAKAIIRFYLK